MSKELSNCKLANCDDSQFGFLLKLKQLLLVICLPALLLACGQKGALFLNQGMKQEVNQGMKQEMNQELNQGMKQEMNQELNQELDQAPSEVQLESPKTEDDKLKKPIN